MVFLTALVLNPNICKKCFDSSLELIKEITSPAKSTSAPDGMITSPSLSIPQIKPLTLESPQTSAIDLLTIELSLGTLNLIISALPLANVFTSRTVGK